MNVPTLRRGFKTWCENAAGGYRRDLGLARGDALDPRLLSRQIGVAIKSPGEISGIDTDVLRQLLVTDKGSWSAITLTVGSRSLIISNSSHSAARQNSNIAHELAHLILQHEPSRMYVSPDGLMMLASYDPTHEEEAGCLSGTLLVPREGLLAQLERGASDVEMAAFFGVSLDLLKMRKNVTGVVRQIQSRAS